MYPFLKVLRELSIKLSFKQTFSFNLLNYFHFSYTIQCIADNLLALFFEFYLNLIITLIVCQKNVGESVFSFFFLFFRLCEDFTLRDCFQSYLFLPTLE